MSANMPATKNRVSPIPFFLLGVCFLGFWILATLLQIQTSEAFILRGPTVALAPNWQILMQPVDLVQGKLSMETAKAAMWGWGMELIFLVCVFGYEVAHDSVKSSSRRLATWFSTGTVILVVFDAWTDFNYGTIASGFWGQIAFAAITTFIVAFFGVVGLRLIEYGFAEWSRP